MAFGVNAQVTSVALVGEAAGGWPGQPGNPGPTDVYQMSSVDGVNWTLSGVTLTTFAPDGGVKFRANNSWDINWGSASFPQGIGTQGGANIQCIAGTYDVEFNSETGAYNFIGGTPLPVVKLVGAAVSDPAGLTMSATSPTTFRASNVTLLDGAAQFEIDGVLLGENSFPTGQLSGATDNIPVVGGNYTSIDLDLASGNYTFTAAPIFPVISIIGNALGGWDPAFEVNMNTTDGVLYTAIVTLDGTPGTNELKFRTGNNWSLPNYGGTVWPAGTASTSAGNLVVGASGTYSVTFNLTTLEYNFFFPTIALVGDATPGGWPTGTPGEVDPAQLTTTDGANYSLASISLLPGGAKFRQNNSWTVNWGAADFPAGTATQDGANISIASAGDYSILFNRVSGVYTFGAPFANNTFDQSNFVVAPNPTNNSWKFASNKAIVSIQIVDVLGNVVATVTPQGYAADVDASNLAKGLYLAKISTANGSETVKLMKN